MYRIPQFQYQVRTEPIVLVSENITEDKWHFPWSEPIVKTRPGLAAARQHFIAFTPVQAGEAPSIDKFLEPWSERIRLDLRKPFPAYLQQAFTIDPRALTVIEQVFEDRWHQAWSEPVRLDLRAARLLAADQQAFTISPIPQPLHPMCYGYIIA